MSTLTESRPLPVRVLKFGGSSVGDPGAICRVIDIVQTSATKNRVVVVVSALARVTNTLDAMLRDPAPDRAKELLNLYRRHVDSARELLSEAELETYRATLGNHLSNIIPALRRVNQHASTHLDAAHILAAGERFSVPLVAAALRTAGLNSRSVDARSLIRVDSVSESDVDHKKSYDQIRRWYKTLQPGEIPIVAGFIAGAPCGRTVTLGRGGSDFTASLLASALNANLLERWTDVDGLFSADPKESGKAEKYEVLRMEDAEILNHANKLGMHEHTITPLLASRSPLRVRSLLSQGAGTLVIPITESSPRRLRAQ